MKKGLSIAIMSAGLMIWAWGGSAAAQKKAVWLLDWVYYSEHVPFFAAKDFGFLKKEGLDLEIKRGFGSGDTIKRIGNKVAPFGLADTGSLIIARSKGVKVKEVAMYYAKTPMVLWYLKEKGYKTPRDMAGKRVGGPQGDATKRVFPAFANPNGLNPKQVDWITMGYGGIKPSVLTGKIDFAPTYYDASVTLDLKAKKLGKEGAVFRYSEWGVDIYANGLIVHDDLIKENPGIIRRFVKANIEAWGHCFIYVEKCMKNFLKRQPTMNPEFLRQQYMRTRAMNIDKGVLQHGFGYMDRAKMDRTIDIMTKHTPLKVRVKTEDVYTNKFLPQFAK